MKDVLVVGNRKSSLTLAALVCGLVLAALSAPPQAAAQFTPEPGAGDFCSQYSTAYPGGPRGTFTAARFETTLVVNISGAGTVTPDLWRTGADCLQPNQTCAAASCSYQVQTVCEFHCSHNHTAPFNWEAELRPTPAAGQAFLGWTGGPCIGLKDAPRTSCLVKMSDNRAATAHFGAQPGDVTQPSAPALSGTATSNTINLSWTPSSDDWLAGYEVYRDGILVARLANTQTTFPVVNLFCNNPYTFQVKAYDSVHESTSNAFTIRTGACTPPPASERPNTALHVKPPKTTRSRTAFFHFGVRGAIPANKFQCRLDRGRWVACSARTGKRYRSLKPGLHTFRVRAGNNAGWDATPATYTWRIRR